MATITKCPPGEAIGARDLQRWSSRRRGGWSGSGKGVDFEDDQFTKQPFMVKCKRCGHSKMIEISLAKLRRARFRCSRCGTRI